MKRRGRHPEKALSAVQIRAIRKPGRYSDGNGLHLVVDPSGAKRWVLRTVVQGRRRDIGLGGLQLVSLAEAREKALTYRKLAREGGDPIAEKRRARVVVPTFKAAATAVHEEHRVAWKNKKHAAQWINTLEQYAYPVLGDRRVDQIDTPDILKVLSPIWLRKPTTARRVKQRIGTIMDWAKASRFRSGENPIDGVAKGLPRQPDRKRHHAALPFADVPAFVERLRTSAFAEQTRLAFEFLILTATRTNELIGARWAEIDQDRAIWTIPAERMKAKREHRVPLPPRCLEILTCAKELAANSEFVFPGRSGGKPMSNVAFLMALRRMKLDVTAHGFRSAFRDWAAERTHFPREVCEMALAHTINDKTEAAYRRGDLFDKRRELMAAWASFVASSGANVVPLHAHKRSAEA
jgi:integrase